MEPLKKKLILGAIVAAVVLLVMAAYLAVSVGNDLYRARDVLEGSVADLDDRDVKEARAHLERASEKLDGIAAKLVGLVPIAGANLNAVDATAEALIPTLDAGLALRDEYDTLKDEGLLEKGAVRLDAIEGLAGPLAEQSETLENLERAVSDHRDGWLLPPLWTALDDVLTRTSDLHRDAEDVSALVEAAPAMLGGEEPRTYLVVLLNNAELRGAGGVLSGVGTMTTDNGRLRLGRLFPVESLRSRPYIRVDAPPEYENRFGLYLANTTLWLNASYSADVPDVALVASRLFEAVTGTRTTGAVIVDPRGLAALMPPDSSVEVPGADRTLTPEELPGFVYSDAYETFRSQDRRRRAILDVGREAFEVVLGGGFATEEGLERAGGALGAGHLRFVSFDEAENELLTAVGASGDLAPPPVDDAFVVAQNFGGGRSEGSKLDFWTERKVRHSCNFESTDTAFCSTSVRLRNIAPEGLDRYVAGYPYGLLRNMVEVYVPQGAEVSAVNLDGEPHEYRPEEQAGRTVLSVYLEIEPGDDATVEATYTLPLTEKRYALHMTPQALARDAEVEIFLRGPEDWTYEGPGEIEGGELHLEETFVDDIDIEAGPEERTGIPAIWDSIGGFLNDPLFD